MSNVVVTPAQVERRLLDLSRELDPAYDSLEAAEYAYATAKARFEIDVAEARMRVASRWADKGVKATVQEKEDEALLAVRDQHAELGIAEATVKAARGNVARLRVQVDIARSLGTSVRTMADVIQ